MCVCVCARVCIAKWSGHRPTDRNVVGSIPGVASLVLLLFH